VTEDGGGEGRPAEAAPAAWPRPLVDLAHYGRDASWPRVRALQAVVFALFLGVTMFLAALVAVHFDGGLERGDVKAIAMISLLAGGMAGALGYDWAAPSERRKMQALLARIYHGDPELVPPPPSADDYPLRLPCGIILGPRRALGGVLYLGPSGFLFVPHLRNAPAYREPIPIGPVRSIVVERVWYRTTRLARLYTGRYGEALRIRWQHGAALLGVPAPDEVQRLIDAELLRWKFDPPAAPAVPLP
jgi:hypothetical protein